MRAGYADLKSTYFSYDVIISNVSPGPLIYCISVVCLGPCVSSAVVLLCCVYINLHVCLRYSSHTHTTIQPWHARSAQFTYLRALRLLDLHVMFQHTVCSIHHVTM